MNRAIRLKPLGGLAGLCVVLAGLSACGQPDEGSAQQAGAEAPVAATGSPDASGSKANDEITSIDADGNVAPFGFASRPPVEVPPLEMAAAAPQAESANLSTVFSAQCVACHGAGGGGVAGLGVSLVESQLVAASSEAELTEFLKVGRLTDSPDSITGVPMPAFAWMSAEQLAEVASYVKQLQ